MKPHFKLGLAGLAVAILALAGAPAAQAGSVWDDIKPAVFGDRPIHAGGGALILHAPYRAEDQRAVPVTVEARLADGRKIKSITVVVDENPSPVAAVFRFADQRDRASLGVNIRLDHASPIRAIVEASDGVLYMAEKFVKASGLGVCAAPPRGDPQVAARTMGQMQFTDLTGSDKAAAATRFRRSAQLDIKHPQNTGMQMDQITLLYVPLRFITTLEVSFGGRKLFDMESGMTLSEDPRIVFDYVAGGAGEMVVRASDTSNTVWQQAFALTPDS
jgi:sulfur-oxidizing protein SoxY